jgi:hypothetical protein
MSGPAVSADEAAMVIVPGHLEIDPATTSVAKIHTFITCMQRNANQAYIS